MLIRNENILFLTIIIFIIASVLMCASALEENVELNTEEITLQHHQPHIENTSESSKEINSQQPG